MPKMEKGKLQKGSLPKSAKIIKSGRRLNAKGCNFCVDNGVKILKNCIVCGK